MLKNFIIYIFLFSNIAFSQTDWVKWSKQDISYLQKDNFIRRDYSLEADNAQDFVLKSLAIVYWFSISDLDGDNCPFIPSCSSFFLESVKETNLIQGTLMFFDRFTRDTNIFGRRKNYPYIKNGKLFDPVTFYTLNKINPSTYKKINLIF
jgi:putative component of membrane protein insertase Oxa1/YidC/SpoIIIJ protein YidD